MADTPESIADAYMVAAGGDPEVALILAARQMLHYEAEIARFFEMISHGFIRHRPAAPVAKAECSPRSPSP